MNELPAKVDAFGEGDPELNALTHAVIGAAIEVHRALGPGYQESVYQNSLEIELELRGIPFRRQPRFQVHYKDREVGRARLDLLIGERVILELKAVESVSSLHVAQLLAYLKMTKCQLGLVINFNVRVLKDGIKRIALSE